MAAPRPRPTVAPRAEPDPPRPRRRARHSETTAGAPWRRPPSEQRAATPLRDHGLGPEPHGAEPSLQPLAVPTRRRLPAVPPGSPRRRTGRHHVGCSSSALCRGLRPAPAPPPRPSCARATSFRRCPAPLARSVPAGASLVVFDIRQRSSACEVSWAARRRRPLRYRCLSRPDRTREARGTAGRRPLSITTPTTRTASGKRIHRCFDTKGARVPMASLCPLAMVAEDGGVTMPSASEGARRQRLGRLAPARDPLHAARFS